MGTVAIGLILGTEGQLSGTQGQQGEKYGSFL